MRIIDLHCYTNTQPWIDCQGPYVRALAEYWDRQWVAKEEADVIADFTSPSFEDLGDDRVRISGARGLPAPDTYKALLGVDTGWAGEIRVGLSFPHAWEKARAFAAIFRKRVEEAGIPVLEWRHEFFGLDALGGPTVPDPESPPSELLLRVAFRCPDAASATAP